MSKPKPSYKNAPSPKPEAHRLRINSRKKLPENPELVCTRCGFVWRDVSVVDCPSCSDE